MSLEPIAYADGETALTGWLARPAGATRGAVVVYPTIMNVTPAIERRAALLAEQGYLALIADFYGERPTSLDRSRHLALAIREGPEAYRRRLRASLRALVMLEEAAGLPLLGIGFCMGGQAVLELAREGAPMLVAVSFHGLLDTRLPAQPGALGARLLICHGDADPMVPRAQVLKFWEEMDAAGADWHFHTYAGVKHGFTNPDPTQNPATAYDASADRQSWAAMHALFAEALEERS